MERWQREQILGEWGVRDGSGRDQLQRRALERALEDGAHNGRPVPRRLRNFRPGVDNYVASLGGPLPYMRRLRAIEDETAAHEEQLANAWRAIAAECGADARAFARRWHAVAERWDFYAVNVLIERHNRNFPAESRLPMDPKTGDFALVGGKPYRRERLDAAWILERFPAELAVVAA